MKSGDVRARRLGLLAACAVLLFGLLGVRLSMLQVGAEERLQQEVDASKLKTVRVAPLRGRIFDAAGRVMADNVRDLTISVEWAAIEDPATRATLFGRLSGWLQMPVEDMEARYDSGRYSRYRPMPLQEGVSEEIAIALSERVEDFAGVTLVQGWRRSYPYAPLASHVVGYLGAITAEDAEQYRALGYDTSRDGELVGRGGLELAYETALHGQWGEIVYEVDAANRIVRTVSERRPVPGMDLQLSIDLDLQLYTERLLQTQLALRRQFTAPNPLVTDPVTNEQRRADPARPGTVNYEAPAGSAIVINHATGQIVALASYPTFDNRWFDAGISGDTFDALFDTDDPDRAVLANRAIQGQYNLGSTFKPFVASAAVAAGLLDPQAPFDDQGTYQVASMDPQACAAGAKCVYRNSTCPNAEPCRYGRINLQQSLAVSSDAYYYALGERLFLNSRSVLQDHVRGFGFGTVTGVDLPYEFAGRIPDDTVKQQLIDSGALASSEVPRLLVGDEINMAIGQGLLAATPLQLAVGYGALATGGQVPQPRVVQAVLAPLTPKGADGRADLAAAAPLEPSPLSPRQAPVDHVILDPIVAGLRQNITGPGANGRSTTAEELFAVGYPPEAIPLAGKTGTAQGYRSYNWNDSSAFAAFSLDPARPYTAVTYLEKAGFGSTGAAPVVKCLFLALSGLAVLDPATPAEPLDPTYVIAATPLPPVDTTCMTSSNAGTVRPPD